MHSRHAHAGACQEQHEPGAEVHHPTRTHAVSTRTAMPSVKGRSLDHICFPRRTDKLQYTRAPWQEPPSPNYVDVLYQDEHIVSGLWTTFQSQEGTRDGIVTGPHLSGVVLH